MKYAVMASLLGSEFDYERSRHETLAEANIACTQALHASIALHGMMGAVVRDPQYIAHKRLDGEFAIFSVEELKEVR